MEIAYSKLTYDPRMEDFGADTFAERRNFEVCVVFRYKTSKGVRYEENHNDMPLGRPLHEPTLFAKNKMDVWKQRRETVLKNLQSCGLQCYCFYNRNHDEILCKIGAEGSKLRDTAARMRYKLQLKSEYLGGFAEYRHDFPGHPELNFTDRRVVSYFYKQHSQADYPTDDGIFSPIDKILLVHKIITSKDKDCAGINLGTLLHQDDVEALFPLHEYSKLEEIKTNWLDWVFMGQGHTMKVHDYFGDSVTFLFLWLSFYWKWLVPVATVGLLFQFVDLVFRTPDNVTTVTFCIFISVWSTFLPHFWRREEAKHAMEWGTLEMADTLEPCRAAYWGEPRVNPVSGQVEPFYPLEKRIRSYFFSFVIIVLVEVLLLGVLLLVVLAKHSFAGKLAAGNFVFSVLLAVVVEIINGVLSTLARFLTTLENHRTQSEHETHQLVKVMCFKFVNSYFVMYYIAFFKHRSTLFGVTMKCAYDDCFLDLQGQLAVFVIFRMIVQNSRELLLPRVRAFFRHGTERSILTVLGKVEAADLSSTEKQAKQETFSSFAEFDEVLITHGYVTFFAVTSPWVCVASLSGTLLEIYITMRSITETKRRPMPFRRKDTEPWSTAFNIYGFLAALTNGLLLIFGSTQFDSWTLTEKLVLFVFLEHVIFISVVFVRTLFPAKPKSVELMQLKQATIVHRCLENIKVEDGHDLTVFNVNADHDFEVFEHDAIDDDREEFGEPVFSLKKDGRSLYHGIMQVMPISHR
eukprot:TRINITY_DN26286_c0_g1_i1.p1 TRINITY_DN26286_c0_g1~~TRINITY_DN26286_c0_g1_i1.p1  ORF type:complete len:745 (-),score=124.68 TRINITY_DN26286_c0_g1_i1:354-2588(-)